MKRYRSGIQGMISLTLLPVFFLVLFCGCGRNDLLPGMELSRRLLIEAIGLDADGNGVTLSLLTMNTKPAQSGSETAQNAQNSRFLQFTAHTVGQAATLAEQTTGQVPFFAHTRLLVIGRTAAERGVSAYLDFFLRNRTVRSMLPVCVAAENAASILSYECASAGGTAQLLEKILSASHACGKCVLTPLFLFVGRLLSEDTEAFCPLLERTGKQPEDPLSVNGTAIFRGERLQSVLTEEETTALLLLLNDLPETLITLDGQTPPVACRIREAKTRFQKAADGAPAFDCAMHIKAEITEADGARYPVDRQKKEQLAEALRQKLAETTASCFEKLYNGERADLCRLRRKLRADAVFGDESIRLRPRISVTLD